MQYLTSVRVSALESSGRTVTTRVALGARFSRSRSYSSSFSDRAVEEKNKKEGKQIQLKVIQERGTQFAVRAVCPMKDDFKEIQGRREEREKELHRQVARHQLINYALNSPKVASCMKRRTTESYLSGLK